MNITITGNKVGIYIDQNNRAYIDHTTATNYSTVNMENVNNLIIHRNTAGELRIIQAAGYSANRGMFCDMY
jgi:hypothetical protein